MITSTTDFDGNANVTTHATALDTLELAFSTIQTHATTEAQNEVIIVFDNSVPRRCETRFRRR